MTEDMIRLVKASRNALQALKYESDGWKGEGFQGDYSEDEIAELESALLPFADVK